MIPTIEQEILSLIKYSKTGVKRPLKNRQNKARLPALHYSVDFIFMSFGIMGFIVEHGNYERITDEA